VTGRYVIATQVHNTTPAARKACCSLLKGYDAGHVIARILGGRGGLKALNIMPIKSSVNRGAMRSAENDLRRMLEHGYRVEVPVNFIFRPGREAPGR
jgi:hypothetical protein